MLSLAHIHKPDFNAVETAGFCQDRPITRGLGGEVKPWIFVYLSWKMESLSQERRFKRSGMLSAGKQRLRGDRVAVYKNLREVNTREELSMLKDNIGMRTTDNKLAMNKWRGGKVCSCGRRKAVGLFSEGSRGAKAVLVWCRTSLW